MHLRLTVALWTVIAAIAVDASAQSIVLPSVQGPSITVQRTAKTGERIYTVETGDSLWSIAEGLYNEPWYWPSLWSYNPQITNPHMIYPGDTIYLSRRATPLVKRRAVTFSVDRSKRKRPTLTLMSRRVGYISARDYRESGLIEGSREERNMLGSFDEVYIKFQLPRCSEIKRPSLKDSLSKAAVGKDGKDDIGYVGPCVRDGDKYVIYRMERAVTHPTTGKRLGFKINFLGEAKVVSTKKKYATLLVTKAHAEISRGDLVTNVFEPLALVKPRKNKLQMVATVVDFHHETNASGQFAYIYIDKGAEQGVKRGNRFEIVWRGDGLRGANVADIANYPDEQIGVAMVIEAYDRHSLAVLVNASREIERGMAAVMAKGF